VLTRLTLSNIKQKQIVVALAIALLLSLTFMSIQLYLTSLKILPSIVYAQTGISGSIFTKHYIPINTLNTSMEGKSTTDSYGKGSQNNNSKPIEGFIIEIDRPDQKLDMPTVENLLKDTGIKLDPDYGPYLVDPKLGHYVVSGTGDKEAQEKAKKIPGVKLFPDLKIGPINKTEDRTFK
jgi:hypothetical protein